MDGKVQIFQIFVIDKLNTHIIQFIFRSDVKVIVMKL